MPIPLAGYNTSGTIDGFAIALTEWDIDPEVDDLDATNTESGGFHVPFPGPVKCDITLRGFYDATENPFAIGNVSTSGLVGLMPGNYVSLTIFVNDNANVGATPFWSFVNEGASSPLTGAMVKGCKVTGRVKEKVMFEARLIGAGVFVYPEGQVI